MRNKNCPNLEKVGRVRKIRIAYVTLRDGGTMHWKNRWDRSGSFGGHCGQTILCFSFIYPLLLYKRLTFFGWPRWTPKPPDRSQPFFLWLFPTCLGRLHGGQFLGSLQNILTLFTYATVFKCFLLHWNNRLGVSQYKQNVFGALVWKTFRASFWIFPWQLEIANGPITTKVTYFQRAFI